MRQNITFSPAKKTGSKGFTLIEMLTVIALILLLSTIAVPTYMRVVQLGKLAATRARISALSTGCEMYRMDTVGQRYYPGQQFSEMLKGSTPSGAYTGSEVLAISLFNAKKGTIIARGTLRDKTGYITYADDWFLKKDQTNLILSDATNDNKAIVYYPSRVGQTGYDTNTPPQFNAFSYQDNATLTDSPNGGTSALFNTFITNPKFPGTPYREETFLLMAPGIERQYFTSGSPSNF